MEPSEHSQPVGDATVIRMMLGKGTIKDLLDASLIDHDGIWQGVIPHRPVVEKGLNPVPYGHVRDADSQLGQNQGGSTQAQALSIEGQPQGGSDAK